MSILKVNNSKTDISRNLHLDLTEISCLDEKIHGLAHKIVSANQELEHVKAELKNIKPSKVDEKTLISEGFSDDFIRFFLRSQVPSQELQNKISELKAQKEGLKTLIAANHEYLSHYEQQMKKCTAVFEKNFPHFKADQISAAREKVKTTDSKDIPIMPIRIPQRGVGLMEVFPLDGNLDLSRLGLQERGQRIFERAMSYYRIKTLYLEAVLTPDGITGVTGPWILLLTNDVSAKEFTAVCAPGIRCIMVNANQSDDEILSQFVFELTNAVSSKKFDPIYKGAVEGKISREEFAKSIERIEHEGDLRHHSIMRHAVNEMRWDSMMDGSKDIPKDFDVFWSSFKNSAHSEFYRNQWDLINSTRTETNSIQNNHS